MKRNVLLFKHFSRKGYALFSCLGREVLVGTLSVATLTYAKADGISTAIEKADTSALQGSKAVMLDEVKVTSSRAPLTLLQSAPVVTVITREDIHRAAVTTINDVLKLATGVDVRQRGGFGVQTDISINGGTFDQITILLNGISISNPQTGHNAGDFPVSLDDIERIEVLEGASSRLFGSNAFSGAINIVTKQYSPDDHSILTASLEGGSYGTVGADVGVTGSMGKVVNHVSGGYSRSDGGTDNSDFNKGRAFYGLSWNGNRADMHVQMGASLQSYGANTFYSAKYDNQFEHTEHGVVSATATIRDVLPHLNVKPAAYWNFFGDHYQLIRGEEGAAKSENYHQLNIYGASVDAVYTWPMGKTSIGADIHQERIWSTAYGDEQPENQWRDIAHSDRKYNRRGGRTNTSFFAEHNVLLKQWTLSAGLLANRNTGLDNDFRLYPGVDVAYRPGSQWKLFASWNKALRMPTYTDLYTNNVVQQGDLNLEPEKNDTYKTGLRYRDRILETVVTAFYSHATNMIDWVFPTADANKYEAMNIGRLNNMGFSVNITLLPFNLHRQGCSLQRLQLGYAYIHQNHKTEQPIYKSLYALEYLRHKVTATLDMRLWRRLSAGCNLRWQQRMNGYHPYFKLDAKVMWRTDGYELFLKGDNLTNHHYFDLGGVEQPGLWLMAGLSVSVK